MPLLQLAQQALLHTAARPPLRITSTPHGPAPSEAAAVNIPASREQVGPAPGGGSGDRGRERPALTAHAYGGGGGGGANDSAPENLDDAPTQAGHHGRADREDGAEEKSDADSAGDTGGSGEDGNEEDGAGDEDDPRTEVVDEEEGEEGEVEDDSSDEESPDEDLSTVPRDSPGGRIPVVKQEDGDIHTPRHQRITPSNECPGAPTTTGHRSARPPEFTLEHRVAISPLQGRRLSVVDLSRPNGVPLRAARVPARANDQQPPRPSMRPPVAPSVLPCIARNPSAVPAGAERALGGPSGIVNPRRSSINEITVLDEDRRARAPERQPYMERSRDIYRVRQLRRGSTLRDTIHQLHGIPATERRDMSPSLPDSNGLLVLQPPRAPVNGDPRVVPPPVPGQRPPEGTPSQRNSPSGIPSPGRGRLRPHPDRVREDARWIRMVRARGNGSTGGPQVSAAGQPHGSAAVQAGPSDALPGAVRQGGPDLGAVRQRADRAVAGAKDTVTKLKAELQEAKRDAQRRGVYADNLTTELNAETQKRLAAEAKVADLQRTVAALQQVVARQQRSEVEFMAAFEQMCANLQELTGTQVSQDGDGDVMVEEDEDEA